MFERSKINKVLAGAVLLGTTCAVAHAQTNVQIYGLVDTGYIKESGADPRMGSKSESRIGFMGSEDLGGGLKATFQLEKRFNVNDGTTSSSYTARSNSVNNTYHSDDAVHSRADGADWKGAANLGLAGDWGTVRFGRVSNIGTEYYNRVDPFGEYSVGSSFTGSGGYLYSENLSNYVRYDSPNWKGFSFGLGFVPKADDDQNNLIAGTHNNYGFNAGLMYDNGPVLLLATYTRMPDTNNSDIWNIGAGYSFGPVTLTAGYQDTDIKFAGSGSTPFTALGGSSAEQKEFIFGVKWDVGPGYADFSYNYAKYEEGSYDGKAHKYAAGYTYEFSTRTAVYGMVSYTDADDDTVGAIYHTNHAARSTLTAVQIGMTHKF